MIEADVGAVDGGPMLVVTPPVSAREEAIQEGGKALPGGERSVGRPAPGFTLDHALYNGRKVRLLKDHVTVIHFWATWCEPCKKSFKVLSEIQARFAAQNVTVIGISVDDESDEIAQFARDHHARFSLAWDAHHKVTELYKPAMMPSTYVIDRTGVVRSVIDGYHDGDKAELEEAVQSLL